MTPKHDAETSTFTRVAAEITSNREKSLTSQRRRCWNPVKTPIATIFSSKRVRDGARIKFKFPDRREIDRHLYYEFRWTRASVKLQALVQNLRQFNSRSRSCSLSMQWFRRTAAVRRTNERRKIPPIRLPFPLLFPLNTMVPEDRGKWGEAMKFFVKTDDTF